MDSSEEPPRVSAILAFTVWVIMTVLGWAIGMTTAFLVFLTLLSNPLPGDRSVPVSLMLGTPLGVALGAAQGLAANSCRISFGKWMLATMFGVISGVLVGFVGPYSHGFQPNRLELARSGVVLGFPVSVFQWLVLRQVVRHAGWWILLATAGVSAAFVFIQYLLTLPSALIYAIVTGIAFVWLLRRPKNDVENLGG